MMQYLRAIGVIFGLLIAGTTSAFMSVRSYTNAVMGRTAAPHLTPYYTNAHHAAYIYRGDTIVPSFAIVTDTILAVNNSGTTIRGRGTGTGHFIVRWKEYGPGAAVRGQVIAVDTLDLISIPKGAIAINADSTNSCAIDSLAHALHPSYPLCGQASLPWPPITCVNPYTVPAPSCVDTVNSAPGWNQGIACDWKQNSATTIACFTRAKNPPAGLDHNLSIGRDP